MQCQSNSLTAIRSTAAAADDIINLSWYIHLQGRTIADSPIDSRDDYAYWRLVSQVDMNRADLRVWLRPVYALYNGSFKARRFLILVFIMSTLLEGAGVYLNLQAFLKSTECTMPGSDTRAIALYG